MNSINIFKANKLLLTKELKLYIIKTGLITTTRVVFQFPRTTQFYHPAAPGTEIISFYVAVQSDANMNCSYIKLQNTKDLPLRFSSQVECYLLPHWLTIWSVIFSTFGSWRAFRLNPKEPSAAGISLELSLRAVDADVPSGSLHPEALLQGSKEARSAWCSSQL